MKIGKIVGSAFTDRIDLELCPNDLANLIEMVENKAVSERDYSFQGLWRDLKDYLQERYDTYKKLRSETHE